MEAGINADQNFYRRQYPQSSGDGQGRRDYEQASPDFDSRPPQVPPKVALATNNVQPVAATGFRFRDESSTPDDFYRDYRGPQSGASYDDVNTDEISTAPSASAAFQQMPPSSRSNSNGTTPKHPTISSSRNALKPPLRSISTPIDDRMALNTAKSTPALNGHLRSQQQPRVKDLLKRFDQNSEETTTARKPVARTPLNGSSSSGPGYLRSRSDMQNQTSNGLPKAGLMTRDTNYGRAKSPPVPRTTQRGRFATEDQLSNNTLSSVPRPVRTRQDVSRNTPASRSLVSLSAKAPSQMPARKPLFGEVVQEEPGALGLGFGIINSRPRRTSDSSLQQTAWSQRRQGNQSEANLSPTSPTEWYRGASPALLDDLNTQMVPRQQRKHARSRSDMVGGKGDATNGGPSVNRDTLKSPAPGLKLASQSRLPVSSKRPATPSDFTSPQSTRATSPSTLRAPAPNIAQTLKPDPRPWSPAGRSTTPTHRVQGRRSPIPAKLTVSGNSSLKAYISAPPPKTSPPLRSSRPRLPVSTATTASSRAKAAERSITPETNRSKATQIEGYDARSSSRIIFPGAVDFAARRERIQKAMSKSIQESEEKELREAAAAAELSRQPILENVPQESHSQEPRAAQDMAILSAEASQDPLTPTTIIEEDISAPTLEIDTSFLAPDHTYQNSRQPSNPADLDSPTLGIPGSYPIDRENSDEDDPRSALSNATGFTEFDNEPQTEPARHNGENSLNNNSTSESLNNHPAQEQSTNTVLTTPIIDASIKIILDTASVEEAESMSIRDEELDVQVPDAPSNHLGFGEPVFTTTSPMQMLEDEIIEASPEIIRSPDAHSSSHRSIAQDQTSSSEDSDCDEPDIPPDEADNQPKILTSGQLNVQPLWESESSVAPPFDLPAIQTGFGRESTTYQPLTETPVTEIDYESSDDARDTMESVNGVYNPIDGRLGYQRESEQSRWTDYSVDTITDFSWQRTQHSSSVPPIIINRNEPPIPPPKEEYTKPGVPPKHVDYSPLPSPRSMGDTPRMTSPARSFQEDFSIVADRRAPDAARTSWCETEAVLPIPAWPDYSPPPPPQPISPDLTTPKATHTPPPTGMCNRPTSSIYRSNHDSESRRESADELTSSRPSVSTPLSSTRISINEDIATTQPVIDEPLKPVILVGEEKELAERQTKRLQKRGHIIKELIDTEGVYLKDMNVVEEIYKGTAEACPKLESSDIKTIFRNTDQIVAFSTMFLDELKVASASVYSPRQKARQSWSNSRSDDKISMTSTLVEESDYERDQRTRIGEYFGRHLKEMQAVYTDFLKSSEQASSRLAALQHNPAVKVWLSECNLVGKDLTAAWDLDALLIKPVQRITRYQLLLHQLLDATPEDHPDHKFLQSTYREVGGLLKSIDDLKKRIETVNKIVGVAGRKRKDSDVRSGLAKAFGRSRDKSISAANRPPEDEGYVKVHQRFSVDYLRLQVVLRDVEYYTRQCQTWTTDFLRYLSAMELFMRTTPSPYPELESKWARFNMSMRDMGTTGLGDHVSAVRKFVIDPMEQVIKAFEPPDLAMKKRKKRRLDFEKYLTLKAANKKIDDKLNELVEQYEALNETLKIELPKLSMMTGEICRISQRRFVGIQKDWYGIWEQKVKTVLEDSQMPKGIEDILDQFHRDFTYQLACVGELSIVNGLFLENAPKDRTSQSTSATKDDSSSAKSKKPPPPALNYRSRGLSINSDHSPSLPTPEFLKRNSDQFSFSPSVFNGPPLPLFSPRDYPPTMKPDSGSPAIQDSPTSARPHSTRPSTGRSYDSGFPARQSGESAEPAGRSPAGSAYYTVPHPYDSLNPSSRPSSGIFHSAMPVEDGDYDIQRSSRTSSQDRDPSGRYNVLYLAASLFEFNIKDTKKEAGYPYLTYQAGEIFDVIAEKGELWLAKNQDDPSDRVGWIWSKHFAKLADF